MSRKKKRPIPRWKKLLVAALGTAVIGGGAIAATNINYFRGERVISVYDGDTFMTENRQSIRLAGLNAPEIENCMGTDAKKGLSSLILGKRVRLSDLKTDPFRRIMALVYLDGTLVNEVMIRAGLAQYTEDDSSEKAKLVSANTYARTRTIGIFSPVCSQPEPPDPACTIKGNNDTKVNKKFYYTSACNNYSQVIIMKYQGDAWFCTEAEARVAGFTKSETCK